jgi:soluble lytic murein transglycosylase-like protein
MRGAVGFSTERPMIQRLLTAVVLSAFAAPLAAEIAIFTDGRSMKVESYAASQESMALILPSGGQLTIPLERVERIIDDEVVPEPVVEAIVDDGLFPKRSWRYDEMSKPLFGSKYDATIIEAAKHFDVDAALVSAVIKAESDYNPKVVSHKGARGLMQLMPATAKRFGVANSFDPKANIYGGTRYLRWLLKTFDGNADLAVAAYNAGEGNVWKYNGIPPFRETIGYVRKISKNFRKESAIVTAAR